MTLVMRRIYVILISLISGLMAWPGVEYVISRQEEFASYLYFCLVLGGVTGIFMGAVLMLLYGFAALSAYPLIGVVSFGLALFLLLMVLYDWAILYLARFGAWLVTIGRNG